MRKPAQAEAAPKTEAPVEGQSTAQPEAPKRPEPVASWQCTLSDLPGGPSLAQFTVGAKYQLKCEGPTITPWKPPAKLYFAQPEETYTLHILETRSAGANAADFVVTGYKPGKYEPAFIDIGDGETLVRAKDLKWNVQSVIQVKQGEEPQPFPAYGPFALALPWWVWASLAGIILFIAIVINWRVRKHMARKRLLERLARHSSALTPYNQFNKDLRGFMRRYHGRQPGDTSVKAQDYLSELDQSFRAYITRELMVPASEWTDREVLRDIRKRHRGVFKESGTELRGLFAEVARAKNSAQVSFTDCDQLHEMSRKVVDHIQTLRRESKR